MRQIPRSLILVLVLLGGGPPSAATATETERSSIVPGPVAARDHFLLAAGFLALEPTPADLLEPGAWRVDALWSVANTWAISPDIDLALRDREERGPVSSELLAELLQFSPDGGSIYVDGEVSRLQISVRRGLGRRTELALVVPLVRFGGGSLDSLIENFHDTLSLSVDGRNGAPQSDFLVSSITGLGRFEQRDPPSSGIGDLVAAVKLRLFGDPSSPLRGSLRLVAKLPTASDEPIATSGSADYGLQILIARAFDRWSIHGTAGLVALGRSERLSLDSQEIASASLSAERSFGRRTSLLVQVAFAESPFGQLATSRVDSAALLGTFALKRAFGRNYEFQLAATDNVENFTNSADLSFHVGVSRWFR